MSSSYAALVTRWASLHLVSRPRLLFSDTHLSLHHGQSTGEALAQILTQYPTAELILAGDVFDLSLEPAHKDITQSLEEFLSAHPELSRALTEHMQRGSPVTFVPGNHDATLTHPQAGDALRRLLQAPQQRSLEVSPWFTRRGGVHIEHGHLYDPDNAFAHPLADHNPRTEPLGTALMRRFVGPQDAIFFAHAHRTTPSSGLRTAFEKWGAKAPWVIAQYFITAFGLVGDAALARSERRREREVGNRRIQQRATELNLEPEILQRLVEIAQVPTHDSWQRTFFRLYFDRIFAATSLFVGLGLLARAGLSFAQPGAGALLTAVGGGYLTQSVLREKNRYGSTLVEDIGHSAHLVREATQAQLVILGHTHVPIEQPGYINLGSFGFGRPTRPYLLLDAVGLPEVRQHQRR